MDEIENFYVDGRFAKPHGRERLMLFDPATEAPLGHVTLADVEDANTAVASARAAQAELAQTTPAQRIAMLQRLHAAVLRRADALRDATILEYGGPVSRSSWVASFAASTFLDAATTLDGYAFERRAGDSTVRMDPVGVSVLITPWNSSAGSVCSKLAMALAAGCASVIKPSELSARQTRIVTELAEGARLLVGGPGRPEGLDRGYYVRPTVFVHVDNRMTIAQEEIFGPVLCVIAYDDEEDAVRIANDTSYGLHAYVFSASDKRAWEVARRLHAGRVAINGFRHDPLAPFGGYRMSGIGREYGVAGLESFLETKAILQVA